MRSPIDGNASRRALEIYEVERAFAEADAMMAKDETVTPAERAAWEAKKAKKDAAVAMMMRRMGVDGNA
jgi:hypothetical protein